MTVATETARATVEMGWGTLAIVAERKTFRTGSRGFFGHGKVRAADGRRYQVMITIVEIGTKPAVPLPVAKP